MLAKGMAKEDVSVQISEQQLRVVLLGPTGEEEFDLDVQLWDKVGTWGRPWSVCRVLSNGSALVGQGEPGQAPLRVGRPEVSAPMCPAAGSTTWTCTSETRIWCLARPCSVRCLPAQ